MEVTFEFVTQLMLQNLHLKVFKSHTLGKLLIYPLAQDRVEELEEEPAEFVLILLYLFCL